MRISTYKYTCLPTHIHTNILILSGKIMPKMNSSSKHSDVIAMAARSVKGSRKIFPKNKFLSGINFSSSRLCLSVLSQYYMSIFL